MWRACSASAALVAAAPLAALPGSVNAWPGPLDASSIPVLSANAKGPLTLVPG